MQEFFIEAKADDDYAVKNLQLVYSVNGGPEKTIRLFDGARPVPEVTAGHTFYMEELGVQAGDSLSYYAKATDNDAIAGANPSAAPAISVSIRLLPYLSSHRTSRNVSKPEPIHSSSGERNET